MTLNDLNDFKISEEKMYWKYVGFLTFETNRPTLHVNFSYRLLAFNSIKSLVFNTYYP